MAPGAPPDDSNASASSSRPGIDAGILAIAALGLAMPAIALAVLGGISRRRPGDHLAEDEPR